METNFYDLVVDELHKVNELVDAEIKTQYKKTNPFRMKPVREKDVLWVYENMAPEDMDYVVQTYGMEAVNDWAYDMEQLKLRRQTNA